MLLIHWFLQPNIVPKLHLEWYKKYGKVYGYICDVSWRISTDVNVHLNESLERFTANGKHEFLPRDQGFP